MPIGSGIRPRAPEADVQEFEFTSSAGKGRIVEGLAVEPGLLTAVQVSPLGAPKLHWAYLRGRNYKTNNPVDHRHLQQFSLQRTSLAFLLLVVVLGLWTETDR